MATGDWNTLKPFLEPGFAEQMGQADWFGRLKELAGDELKDPGVTLVYQRLWVEDAEIPEVDSVATIEEWCEGQNCRSYTYSDYAEEYEPDFGSDENAIGIKADRYPIPDPWVPPSAGIVILRNPEGWLDLSMPVRLSALV